MKKSQISADTFAAKLSDKELAQLESDLSDSKKIGQLRITCQLEQIRRGGRRKEPSHAGISTAQQREANFKKGVLRMVRQQLMGELCVLVDSPHSRKIIEEQDPILKAAMYAQAGLNDRFDGELKQAVKNLDIAFFDKVQDAMKAVKQHTTKNKLRKSPIGKEEGKHSFGLHVFWVVYFWDRRERQGKSLPTKTELRSLVSRQIEAGGGRVYIDKNDWKKVWCLVKTRCGIEPLQLRKGRSQESPWAKK